MFSGNTTLEALLNFMLCHKFGPAWIQDPLETLAVVEAPQIVNVTEGEKNKMLMEQITKMLVILKLKRTICPTNRKWVG